jgi:beta-glucanase (GH16 family)
MGERARRARKAPRALKTARAPLLLAASCALLLAAACASGGSSSQGSSSYPWNAEWKVVFEEDFSGAELDAASWTAITRGGNWNEENQAYDPGNAYLADGELILRSEKKTWTGPVNNPHHPDAQLGTVTREYVSAQVESRGKKSWLYGRFECMARMETTHGMLNAIWMCAEDGSWPPEIDIAELLGNEPWKLYATNHYGGQGANHRMNGGSVERDYSLSDGYHLYGVEWEPNEIRWYLDGELIHRSTDGVPAKAMYFILCPAIGPAWTGDPDEASSFPLEMRVDYVRISQRIAEEDEEAGL